MSGNHSFDIANEFNEEEVTYDSHVINEARKPKHDYMSLVGVFFYYGSPYKPSNYHLETLMLSMNGIATAPLSLRAADVYHRLVID